MKYFEPSYLFFLVVNIINWIINAKDFASGVAALVLAILTCIYMYHKGKDMRASAKLKEEELKRLRENNDEL
jgi:hypothetical protein